MTDIPRFEHVTKADEDWRVMRGCVLVIMLVLLVCVGSGLVTTWVSWSQPSPMEACATMCGADKVARFERGDCFCVVEEDPQRGEPIDE